jgi:hypothetical protein
MTNIDPEHLPPNGEHAPPLPPIIDYGVKSYGTEKRGSDYSRGVIAGCSSVFLVPTICGMIASAVHSPWPMFLSPVLIIGLAVWFSYVKKVRGYLLGILLAAILIGLLALGCGIILSQAKF